MICAPCAHAADQQLGQDEHCNAQPGPAAPCDCQHRTDRYRQTRPAAREGTAVVIHVHPDPPHLAGEIRDIRRNGVRRR